MTACIFLCACLLSGHVGDYSHSFQGPLNLECNTVAASLALPSYRNNSLQGSSTILHIKFCSSRNEVICLYIYRDFESNGTYDLCHINAAPDPIREETKGRFGKTAALANVPSFRLFGTVVPFFVPSFRFFGGASFRFFVPSFRFRGFREHPPKPPFWKPHCIAKPRLMTRESRI